MFRIAFFASVIFLGLAGVLASAQTLPEVTVTALSISSERLVADPGQAFHLTIHVHAKQRSVDLSSLVLPDVTDLSILGDEKHTTQPKGGGTDYVEILTVAGTAPGVATVSPAYIDARDPSRGDRPFRFSSNSLRLQVRAAREPQPLPWRRWLGTAARIAGAVVLGVVVLAFLGFAARRRQTYVTLPPARPVRMPPVDPLEALRAAAQRLQRERSRGAAAAVRTALFTLAGARPHETLASLMARIPEEQAMLRHALRKAERATFVDERNLQGAIGELLDALVAVGCT